MEAKAMRPFFFTTLAAGVVLASAAIGTSADANAAVRHPHYRTQAVPYVRQNPYTTLNTFDAPGIGMDQGRRDWNPISGTPRWNALGTAP
jgi:hypothetical protein